jgi:DNA-binding transcriptional LysR family regulator
LEQNKLKQRTDTIYHADLAEVLKATARYGHGVAWLPKTAVDAALGSGQLVNLLDTGMGIRNADELSVDLPIILLWQEPLTEQGELIAARAIAARAKRRISNAR